MAFKLYVAFNSLHSFMDQLDYAPDARIGSINIPPPYPPPNGSRSEPPTANGSEPLQALDAHFTAAIM